MKHKCYDLEVAFKTLRDQSAKVEREREITRHTWINDNMNFPQHGRHIETMCVVIDFENLSIQRHYYWPGIEALKAVSGLFRIHVFN